ncbi:Protein Z-dependent protease inhibitor [Merluccius polli]|uniref:Protein Z-dependent protease inhibitor n=1 Tax=Merluccius polli TaxID=89951 RepID=A0AA47LZE9_MERPO|nr:Protein Z-dependent protease inhibitor [Merluccius polli]
MSGGLWILGAAAALLCVQPAVSQELSSGNADFASRLYRAVARQTDDNVLALPARRVQAPWPCWPAGSEGATRQQLLEALRLGGLDPQQIPGLFQGLLNSTTEDGVFPQNQGVAWSRPSSGARPRTLSYASQQEAMDSVNLWAESQTADQIKDVVGSLDPQTQLLVVSVAYYHTQFSFTFNASVTQDERFYVDRYRVVMVPMMFHSGKHFLAYDPSLSLGLLKLPMAGGAAMLVMLPDENVSVTSVEEALTVQKFREWVWQLKKTKLEVQLPRFLLKRSYTLRDVLTKMDVKDVFQDTADLSVLSAENGLRLTQLATADVKCFGVLCSRFTTRQQSQVDEGNPVTGGNTADFFTSPPPRLTINRPFLFIIYHQRTSSILHIGRVVDPSHA